MGDFNIQIVWYILIQTSRDKWLLKILLALFGHFLRNVRQLMFITLYNELILIGTKSGTPKNFGFAKLYTIRIYKLKKLILFTTKSIIISLYVLNPVFKVIDHCFPA